MDIAMASGREKVISILDAPASIRTPAIKRPLFGLKNEQLSEVAAGFSAPAYRSRQLAQALYKDWTATLDDVTTLPKSLRDQLAEAGYGIGLPEIAETFKSVDGTERYSSRPTMARP
jgi:23S rRNA (adenine2503-C2)-methyltransferase